MGSVYFGCHQIRLYICVELSYVEDMLYWGSQIEADSVMLPTLRYNELVRGSGPPAARA